MLYVLTTNNVISSYNLWHVSGITDLVFFKYVSIIGIVFATIWTRRQYWNKHDTASNDYPLEEHRRARTVLSTLHIVSENEEGSIYEGARISPLNNSTGKRQGNIDINIDIDIDSNLNILNSSQFSSTKTQSV